MAQKEVVDLMTSFDKERHDFAKQMAAANIVQRMRKLRLARMASRFWAWQRNTVLVGAAAQFRVQMEGLVKATLETAKQDKEVALETQRRDSADALAAQAKAHDSALRAAVDAVRQAGRADLL